MKGIYVLIISVDRDTEAEIGKLGEIVFRKGLYAYVGSAQNGIEKRVSRHLSDDKKLRWHIDYLLSDEHVKVLKVFYSNAEKEEECRIAGELAELGKPMYGFGCSDCNCESHLFMLGPEQDTDSILKLGMKEMIV